MPTTTKPDVRAELLDLLGTANVVALEAWLIANGLSIVRLPE